MRPGIGWRYPRPMPGRLHPTDAQTYWMSAKIPNDQFLLYCFDTDASAASVRDELIQNAQAIADLQIRISEVPFSLGYPRMKPMRIRGGHVRDRGRETSWPECLAEISSSFDRQLDQSETPWCIHLFAAVDDAPRCTGPALVAVLQISHALGDGRIASHIARRLFGDHRERMPTVLGRGRFGPREFVRRSKRAHELDRILTSDTESGAVPAQAPGRPLTRVNVAPSGTTSVRCVVRESSELTAPGISVTVGATTAISVALARYLERLGDSVPASLGAEVTMSKTGTRQARNHFRNSGVDLFPVIENLAERAERIAASLADRRARAEHPAMEAQSLATEMVPAVLLHWGIRQFDATAVPDAVTGNTVVSSVARGDDNLFLGGGRVRFTAGFPALSPVMGLTHGVHGIGDAVTLSVTSSESAVPDPDVYEALLHDAVDEVADALRRRALPG